MQILTFILSYMHGVHFIFFIVKFVCMKTVKNESKFKVKYIFRKAFQNMQFFSINTRIYKEDSKSSWLNFYKVYVLHILGVVKNVICCTHKNTDTQDGCIVFSIRVASIQLTLYNL